MKKPTVNQDLCIGCGLCESICPEVFRLDENFKSEVVGECEDEEKCQEAIDDCPVGAISWGSGQRFRTTQKTVQNNSE